MQTMTAVQLNAQIWRDMAAIAENELLMKQLARYLKKLVTKKEDPTLMTKDEFFARVDRAREQISRDEGHRFANVEELDKYIRSL